MGVVLVAKMTVVSTNVKVGPRVPLSLVKIGSLTAKILLTLSLFGGGWSKVIFLSNPT